MPLRLNVGVSRKLGLPGYSSVGASCHIDLEVDSMLIHADLNAFHAQVRGAFLAAQQAVDDELARLQAQPATPVVVPAASANGHDRHPAAEHGPDRPDGHQARPDGVPARAGGARNRSARPASEGQVKAIYAIARSQQADLEGLLRDEYGVERPEALSLGQASRLIDQLKAAGTV
jgi:hypothetical protein